MTAGGTASIGKCRS